ncbi:MAG: thioredoxin family protein [bacterium]|nr:thioredoxin family protein [bacterium]
MKPFNGIALYIVAVVIIGLIFFKDGFNRLETKTNALEKAPQVLYDRVNYLDYSAQNFTSSQKYGKTLLFFAATTWCSNCAELDAEIKKKATELPSDITILKVDYDRDKEMKAKYGVTMQTTLVLLDKNGTEEKRWIGTGSFGDLLENIN